MPLPGPAQQEWARMLARWAIPEELVAAAPESPYFFDPAVFIAGADEALGRPDDTPSDETARAALPSGGVVLDVGAGAGAASLRLAGQAGRIVAVDSSTPLLEAFGSRAFRAGVAHDSIEGTWPEVAPQVPEADVVVCHHVLYNVAAIGPFVAQLTAHASRRVVVEVTAVHPMAWMSSYWSALHGRRQPDRPVADDVIAVLREAGLSPREHRWRRPVQMIGESGEEAVARVARRLCLARDRYEELRRVLATTPPPAERDVVTLWWDGRAGSGG